MSKSQLRKKTLATRKRKHQKFDEINYKSIIKIIKKKKINNIIIGGYYPYNYEVNAIKILEKFEKLNFLITLPKIKKNFQMDFYNWSTKDPLKINKYGIPEPISSKKIYPDVIFVPLVAYDNDLNRLGYGGGFYDRYLKKITKIKKILKIGLAFSYQELKKIPINKHDMKLDLIITDKKIIQ